MYAGHWAHLRGPVGLGTGVGLVAALGDAVAAAAEALGAALGALVVEAPVQAARKAPKPPSAPAGTLVADSWSRIFSGRTPTSSVAEPLTIAPGTRTRLSSGSRTVT